MVFGIGRVRTALEEFTCCGALLFHVSVVQLSTVHVQ